MMIRDRTLRLWGSLLGLHLAISLFSPGLAGATDQPTALDRMVQEIHDKQKNVGLSAAVIQGEQIVYTRQLGHADLENQVPVTPETGFGISSITKAFTAVVLLQLVAEGEISLAAPVQNYVREFPTKPEGPITVSDLARHQSGIPHPQKRTPEFYATHYESAVEAMKVFADEDLLFEPGTDSKYLSSNYNLLAAVIEKVTGKHFLQVVQTRILDPLKLTKTGFDDVRFVLPNRARRYSYYHPYNYKESKDIFVVPLWDYSFNWGGGNMYSTAEDLVRFGSSLFSPGLLPAAEYEIFVSEDWFGGRDDEGRLQIYLSGGNPGVQAGLLIYPELQVAGATLANTWGVGSRSSEMIKLAGELAIQAISKDDSQ